jgi:lipopolysaccharide/colanic/teichoic acid biosynthesis glycosyltransferase
MQRFFDILFSGLAILVLSPLLLSVVIILKLSGEGEVFFKQERIGKDLKKFSLLKFATMVKNSENMGAGTVTLKNDPRVLPVGKFLRKTKLNELPQLFNIFIGDMSIIGPRPLHIKQFSFYESEDQKVIASVLPGLSGLGSIIFRDEEKMLQSSKDPDETYKQNITPEKAKLEKLYIKNISLFLYFKLIILTVIVVILPNIDTKIFFKEL